MTPAVTRPRSKARYFLTAAQVVAMAAIFAGATLVAQGYGPTLLEATLSGAEDLFYGILRQRYVIQNLLIP